MNYGEMEQDEDVLVEPFRITPGFISFVAAVCLPAFVALFIFFGAWLVADEVYAAEESVQTSPGAHQAEDVEGWKKTLVGICPIH